MKISKEFSVGVFVIIGCVITYCGNMFLKGNRLFSNDKIYYAYIEKLSGISVGTPILINEYNVGCVRNIEFLVNDGFKSKLTLSIRGDIQLTKNSLIYSGSTLMGTSFISLSVNPGEILNEEESINIGISKSLLDDVKAKVSPAIDSFNNLCINTNEFIGMINNEQTKIVEIINDLSLTIKNIKDASIVLQNHLDNIAGNINGILLSVNDNEQGIRSVMAKTNSILSKIDNIEFNELTSKVEECIRKVHESMLVENTNETVLELQNTVNSLNKLLVDIRLNPKRYVHFSVF